MNMRHSVTRWFALCGMIGVAGLSHATACSPCPEPAPFPSGEFLIKELVSEEPEPLQQWIIDRAIGAELTVDENKEATIRYTRDGTIYEVRYTIKGSPP